MTTYIKIYNEAQFTDTPNAAQIVRVYTDATLAQVQTAGWLNGAAAEGLVLSPNNQYLISYNSGANVSFFNLAVSNHVYTLSLATNNIIGPSIVTTTLASATPGTVRSLVGKMVNSVLMTSGNIVGVRGEVDYVGASGGFVYGVQGKIICTGALTSSEWSAGVFGQLDISTATINAGQIAPIWGDYGTTSGTLTSETGMYGIAMTNTTAAVLAGQLYLYGGATNLMLLNTNAGLSGTTYFKAAGTSSGSAGYSSGCNATEVLQISVNGTTYYLPCFAQNS